MNLSFTQLKWKILNPKHEILNKFEYLNPKFKTNLSKESFTKERFRRFCHWNFGNLILFSVSDLVFRISIAHKVLRKGGEGVNAIYN